MASIIAHELKKRLPTPDLNAWYDNRGMEKRRQVRLTFGTTQTAVNGSKYNVTLGALNYLISTQSGSMPAAVSAQ